MVMEAAGLLVRLEISTMMVMDDLLIGANRLSIMVVLQAVPMSVFGDMLARIGAIIVKLNLVER